MKTTKQVYDVHNILQKSLISNPVKYKRLIQSKNKWERYELLEDIHVKLTNGKEVTIPAGFRYDLSSSPRFLWWLLPPDGDFAIAALIHDWLYVHNNIVIEWFDGCHKKARKFADDEMLTWSKAINSTSKISMHNIDNYIRYYGVAAFGWYVWHDLTLSELPKYVFSKKCTCR